MAENDSRREALLFNLAIALLWFAVYLALLAYKPHAPLGRVGQIEMGCWAALVLAGYNLLRGGVRLLLSRRRRSPTPPSDEPAPRPVIHPEFRVDDEDAIGRDRPPS
jgi:hypothetical protein